MDIFFRRNASGREKAFTVAFCGWMGLVIYGVVSGFVPEEWVESGGAYLALAACVLFFLPIGLFHPSSKLRSYSPVKRFSILVVSLPVCYGVTWAALALGSAALATHFFGYTFSGSYVVTGKGTGRFHWGRYGGGCRYAVYVKNPVTEWHTRLCTDRALWEIVKTGDSVTGTVHQSSFGVLVEELSPNG